MGATTYRVWATGDVAAMQKLDAALRDQSAKRLTVYDVPDLEKFESVCRRLGLESDVLYAHKGEFRDPKAAGLYLDKRRAVRERYKNGEIFRPADLRALFGVNDTTVPAVLKVMAGEREVKGYGNGKARFYKMLKSLREAEE